MYPGRPGMRQITVTPGPARDAEGLGPLPGSTGHRVGRRPRPRPGKPRGPGGPPGCRRPRPRDADEGLGPLPGSTGHRVGRRPRPRPGKPRGPRPGKPRGPGAPGGRQVTGRAGGPEAIGPGGPGGRGALPAGGGALPAGGGAPNCQVTGRARVHRRPRPRPGVRQISEMLQIVTKWERFI